MTTALGPEPPPVPSPHKPMHRRADQRRRTAEKVLAAFVLFVAFGVTVVLLGLQWLDNQGSASSAAISTIHTVLSEVHTC